MLKHPLLSFLVKLALFLLAGMAVRELYHSVPVVHEAVIHSSVINWMYLMLMVPVSFLLSLSGIAHELSYSVSAAQYYILLNDTGNSLFLWIPCLGVSLIYIYIALTISFPGTWKHKLIFSLAGMIIIELLNISRLFVMTVLLSGYHAGAATHSTITPWLIVSHETVFNYSVIILIFLFFIFSTSRIKLAQLYRK